MIKLRDILNEIGDGSSKPFKYFQSTGVSGFKDAKNDMYGTRKGLRSQEGIAFYYVIEAKSKKHKSITVGLNGVIVTPGRAEEVEPETYVRYKKAVSKLGINLDDPEVANVWTDLYIEFDAYVETKTDDTEAGHDVLVNDKEYMFRLMATIREILLKEVQKNNAHAISYTPSKRGKEGDKALTKDLGRTKLYSVFINNAFPGSKRVIDDNLVIHQIRPVK